MIEEIIICALAAWTVTYGVTFSVLFEWLRVRIGIGYDFDDQGLLIDRWAENKLAQLVNCAPCTSFWATLLVVLLWLAGAKPLIEFFAVAGLVLLAGRWWVSQDPKKDWWL